MDAVEIQKMNTVERLQAMEMLWDALLHEEVEVQSPGWHQGIIKERISRVRLGFCMFKNKQIFSK